MQLFMGDLGGSFPKAPVERFPNDFTAFLTILMDIGVQQTDVVESQLSQSPTTHDNGMSLFRNCSCSDGIESRAAAG
jgi:hypothetical protein